MTYNHVSYSYKGQKILIEESLGHDDFPFFDGYINGKWRTCGTEDLLDVQIKVEAIVDREEVRSSSSG